MTDRASGGRPEAGVTLVELMIVLVLVSIGVITLAAVQTRSSTSVYDTGRNSRALAVAQERMEIARAAGFGVAQTDSGVVGTYTWRTEVDSAGPRLERVRVTVRWSDRETQRLLELNNLMSER